MRREWQQQRPSPAQVSTIIASSNDPHHEKPGIPPSASPAPTQAPRPRLKRARHRADVDGEGSENFQKKKRRLRLELITSRLSKPYATPPTHIISRSAALRIGISRQKVLGKNLLRKAACLNSIRIKRVSARETEQSQAEFAKMVSMYNNVYVTDADRRTDAGQKEQSSTTSASLPQQNAPSPPNQLDQADYDAFDFEEDSDEEEDDETDGNGLVYSDFNSLSSDDDSSDDEIFLDPFISYESEPLELPGSSKDAIGLLLENERREEVSAARCVL